MQAALARGAEPSARSVLLGGSSLGCGWWMGLCPTESVALSCAGSARAGRRKALLTVT